ncbi:Fic family protein [Burkholderia cepacia]|uniref:Fic family protein n=1 Tax=Burkholderia cepacia TaxID=292 RepID=UPI000AA288C9
MRLPESPENRAALNRYVEWRWKRSKATTLDRSRWRGLWSKGIDAEEAGRYRRENVVIAGASTTPPDFMHLPAEMAALIDWYEAAGDMYPVERAAELHTRFAKIHPFIDGLDRDGRRIRKRAADRSRSRGDIREP